MNMLTPLMKQATFSAALGLAAFTLTGCGHRPESGRADASASSNDVDAQNHPVEGPHQGGLIELGDEEYHAELVHDQAAGSVTIYMLDSAAKTAAPIDAAQLAVNLTHDGQAEQFTLDANPEPHDPSGQASRFTSTDPELAEELHHDHGHAQLVVSIEGKQYRGSIIHDLEQDSHAGHGH